MARGMRITTLLLAAVAGAGAVAAAVLLARGESDAGTSPQAAAADAGPVHVHGLGVNPADGALFVATHTGLFRVAAGEARAERVGESRQDTMGFTVVGPDHFLGSGHPDFAEARARNLPPHLGLIESADAGETWEPVSLLGEADFHVLRVAGQRVYGYDASNDRLLASVDRGRSWSERAKPGPLLDLAVDPADPERLVAASVGGLADGLFESRDGGGSWTRVSDALGLLAWADELYLLSGGGRVFASGDGGRRLRHRGDVAGEPAAFAAAGSGELYVALHDGTIARSTDGGASWGVRSTP